jgi:hypothetical protein
MGKAYDIAPHRSHHKSRPWNFCIICHRSMPQKPNKQANVLHARCVQEGKFIRPMYDRCWDNLPPLTEVQ